MPEEPFFFAYRVFIYHVFFEKNKTVSIGNRCDGACLKERITLIFILIFISEYVLLLRAQLILHGSIN